jgi:hypothetical protein
MRTATEVYAALAALKFDYAYSGTVPPPWIVDVDGAAWVVGTDGLVMVAFRQPFAEGPTTPAPERYAKHVYDHLLMEAAEPAAVPASWLANVAGLHEPPPADCDDCKNTGLVVCGECDGDGKVECECMDCGHEHSADCECDDGKVECGSCDRNHKPKPVRLLGANINVRCLAVALRAVLPDEGDEALTIGVDKQLNGAYIVRPATHDSWRIVVMGMAGRTTPATSIELPPSADARLTDLAEGKACGSATPDRTLAS